MIGESKGIRLINLQHHLHCVHQYQTLQQTWQWSFAILFEEMFVSIYCVPIEGVILNQLNTLQSFTHIVYGL